MASYYYDNESSVDSSSSGDFWGFKKEVRRVNRNRAISIFFLSLSIRNTSAYNFSLINLISLLSLERSQFSLSLYQKYIYTNTYKYNFSSGERQEEGCRETRRRLLRADIHHPP